MGTPISPTRRILPRQTWRLFAACVVLLSVIPVRADPPGTNDPSGWAWIAGELPPNLSVREIAALPDSHFTPYDSHHTRRSAPATPQHPIWLKLRLSAAGNAPQAAVIVVGRGYEDFVDVFLSTGAGEWSQLRGGEAVPPAVRAWHGLRTAFPILLPARGQNTVAFVRIIEPHRPEWTLTLVPQAAAFAGREAREIALSFAYFGALAAIFAYNLFLYWRLRYRDLLYYLGYLAVFGVMMANETFASALFVALPGWRDAGSLALFNLATAALLMFVREYHELPRRAPRLAALVAWLAGVFVAALAIWLVDVSQGVGLTLYRINTVMDLAVGVVIPVVSILAWRRGARQARFFLVAFGCSLAGAGIATLNTFVHVLPPRMDDAVALAGSACEFILLSFAIGDRFRRIREEKDALQANYASQLENDVAARTAELARMNVEKEELMGVVAHDLRAPLGAMRGTAQLVRASPTLTAPDDREAIDDIATAAERMLQIASSLLDRHAIQSGHVPVRLAAAGVQAALHGVAKRFQPTAAAKRQSIAIEAGDENLTAWHDPALLAQVLDNFVSNGLKFSPPGATLRLTAGRIGPEAVIRLAVHDLGPGLSEADEAKVFQPFARLDARPTAGEESIGLGLAAARKLALAMGGRVGAENAADRRGAVFWVELPAA